MDKKDTNIVGTRIGLYDVLYECDFKSNDGHRMFHVKCSECGWESNVQMHQIKMLSKKCKHINLAGQYSTDKAKIIWNNKRIFKIYQGMIQRCYNPNNKRFKDYGGRGIIVCDEWKDSYLNFKKWAVFSGYKEGLSIDRKNNDLGYSPSNCRWVTRIVQQNNMRKNHIVEYNGQSKTIAEWSRELNIKYDKLWKSIKKGLGIEDILKGN